MPALHQSTKPGLRAAIHAREMADKYGVQGNPKFPLCYQLAWDYGHSAGFAEVEHYFAELVELIK